MSDETVSSVTEKMTTAAAAAASPESMDSMTKGRSDDAPASNQNAKNVNPQEPSSPPLLREAEAEIEKTVTIEMDEGNAKIDGEGDSVHQEIGNPTKDLDVVATSNGNQERMTKRAKHRKGYKQRKRGRRYSRVVKDLTEDAESNHVTLPLHHFEVELRRRAVRKAEDAAEEKLQKGKQQPVREVPQQQEDKPHEDADSLYDEDVGDVSLGMKLGILGGKVIVQAIKPLADGRASPAQLTGRIAVGDVLIAIDGRSIVEMPIDQLVGGLKPLSSPQQSGAYKRSLKLRFSTGEGLELLKKDKEKKRSPDAFNLHQYMPQDTTAADQHSGGPLVGGDVGTPTAMDRVESNQSAEVDAQASKLMKPIEAKALSLNDLISGHMADSVMKERETFVSEYFAWNDENTELLKPSEVKLIHLVEELNALEKQKETLAQGMQAIKAAKVFSFGMDDIDKGKDLRSFKAWNSNISLRSRASTRRQYVLDTATLIGSTIAEVPGDSGSEGSDQSDDLDGMNGDELLLQLAAHDAIWRRQVLEAIEKTAKEMAEEEEKPENPAENGMAMPDILGSLLGDHVNNLLTKKQRSYALPPDEVTSVLFDLVTHLASTTPDQISLRGKFDLNPQTSLLPFRKTKHSDNDDRLLASRFVLHDVLPRWLKSFRPLPWDERRVLWPYAGGSTANDTVAGSLDDALTLDSGSAAPQSPSQKKSLREKIEDIELDMESRAEACFLITFYFTQEMLPSLAKNLLPSNTNKQSEKDYTEEEILGFVDTFGAYLKLPMCVAYAAYVESEIVLEKLLLLAENDLRHIESLKEISKLGTIFLYEPTKLSALSSKLQDFPKKKLQMQSQLINFSVLAYPDLRPWQVRKACLIEQETEVEPDCDLDILAEFYYSYLSQLLHPSDGHDSARSNERLVKEWCKLSINPTGDKSGLYNRSRRENFVVVASRKSTEYRLYRRDLAFLMDLSMTSKESDLVLEIIDEMLDSDLSCQTVETIATVGDNLRSIGKSCLARKGSSGILPMKTNRLKTVFRLFEKLNKHQEGSKVAPFDASVESLSLLEACSWDEADEVAPTAIECEFLDLMAVSTSSETSLKTLEMWTSAHGSTAAIMPVVQKIVHRTADTRNRSEVSSCLLRIQNARRGTFQAGKNRPASALDGSTPGVWSSMAQGNLSVAK